MTAKEAAKLAQKSINKYNYNFCLNYMKRKIKHIATTGKNYCSISHAMYAYNWDTLSIDITIDSRLLQNTMDKYRKELVNWLQKNGYIVTNETIYWPNNKQQNAYNIYRASEEKYNRKYTAYQKLIDERDKNLREFRDTYSYNNLCEAYETKLKHFRDVLPGLQTKLNSDYLNFKDSFNTLK